MRRLPYMITVTVGTWTMIWKHRISTIGYVLSLSNFTTIYWVLRCMAFIPPGPTSVSCDVNQSEK